MTSSLITFRLNTYIATLILTVFGAGAALLIIHVANASQYAIVQTYSNAEFVSVQQALGQARTPAATPRRTR